MFPAPTYLQWAERHYGNVPFDLATSGTPSFSVSELGPLPDLDDPGAWGALAPAIAAATGLPAHEIAPALGTSHAIFLACQSILEPGDHVLLETPFYEPMALVPRALGAAVESFERPRGALDIELVLSRVTPRTRLVAISNIHNPTGVRVPDEAIADLARRLADVALLVDEVYAPFDRFLVDGRLPSSARTLGENITAVSSLTKVFGAGPHRVGWVAGPPEICARARGAVRSTCGLLPLSHAALSIHSLQHLDALAARARSLLGHKRDVVADWIARRGLDWTAPESGLFGFVYMPSARDLRATLDNGARDHGVLVAPGSFFGDPTGFRLAWSIPEDQLVQGLVRLERVLSLA